MPFKKAEPAKGPSHKGYKATPDEDRSSRVSATQKRSAEAETDKVKVEAEKEESVEIETTKPAEPPVYTATKDKPRTV